MEDETSDRENYKLSCPDDFREYLNLIFSNNASEIQSKEFALRIIKHFIEKVEAQEKPEDYAMKMLAYCFGEVINFGAKWENVFPLPWSAGADHFKKNERRDLLIYEEYQNEKKKFPKQKAKDIKSALASKHRISEKAVELAISKKRYDSIANKINAWPS